MRRVGFVFLVAKNKCHQQYIFKNLPATITVVAVRFSPNLLDALHSYTPLSPGITFSITRMRPLFFRRARVISLSPSLLHLTKGSGTPLTSQVSNAKSPTIRMVFP